MGGGAKNRGPGVRAQTRPIAPAASHGEDDRRSKKSGRTTLAKARSDGTAEGGEAWWGGKFHGLSYGVGEDRSDRIAVRSVDGGVADQRTGEDTSRGPRSENRSGQGGSRVDSGRAWPWPADGGEMEVEWPEMPTAPRREGKGEGNRVSEQLEYTERGIRQAV